MSVSFNPGGGGIRHDGGMTPRNDLGVLDHYLTLESAEVIYVPLRVIADGTSSEVVFTVRRRPGMTDAEFKADGAAVTADLARLKRILEH